MGTNDELFCDKINPANLLGILGWLSIKISPCAHMYRHAVCTSCFTIHGTCAVFGITLTWIVQYYLQLVLCLVISIIAIQFCTVSWKPTSPNFKVFRISWHWPHQTSRYSELAGPHCKKVTSFHLQCSTALFPSLVACKFRILFKMSLLTYKLLHENQPVYLHSMLAPSLLSHSRRCSQGISL